MKKNEKLLHVVKEKIEKCKQTRAMYDQLKKEVQRSEDQTALEEGQNVYRQSGPPPEYGLHPRALLQTPGNSRLAESYHTPPHQPSKSFVHPRVMSETQHGNDLQHLSAAPVYKPTVPVMSHRKYLHPQTIDDNTNHHGSTTSTDSTSIPCPPPWQ